LGSLEPKFKVVVFFIFFFVGANGKDNFVAKKELVEFSEEEKQINHACKGDLTRLS